jgi:hypothetical protein
MMTIENLDIAAMSDCRGAVHTGLSWAWFVLGGATGCLLTSVAVLFARA